MQPSHLYALPSPRTPRDVSGGIGQPWQRHLLLGITRTSARFHMMNEFKVFENQSFIYIGESSRLKGFALGA